MSSKSVNTVAAASAHAASRAWLIFRSDRRRFGIGRMANSSGIAGSGLVC
jgi:hypothetical protein